MALGPAGGQVIALVGADAPGDAGEFEGGGGDGREVVQAAFAFALVVAAKFALGADGHGGHPPEGVAQVRLDSVGTCGRGGGREVSSARSVRTSASQSSNTQASDTPCSIPVRVSSPIFA